MYSVSFCERKLTSTDDATLFLPCLNAAAGRKRGRRSHPKMLETTDYRFEFHYLNKGSKLSLNLLLSNLAC